MSDKLLFSKHHLWIRIESETARIGITDYAQDKLGAICFINLPDEGENTAIDQKFGDIESIKTVSDLIAPAKGAILHINEELVDEPEEINDCPYDSWLIEIKIEELGDNLMNENEYEKYKESL